MGNITFEEAKNRLSKTNNYIELIEYEGWSKKALFLDKVINETFEAVPDNVLRQGAIHPKRRKNQAVSKKEALQRFQNKRSKLCEYYGWTKKSKFIDSQNGKEFWDTPQRVFIRNLGHPENRKNPITKKEALKRFQDRLDIELIEYRGWSKKSTFREVASGIMWEATPASVWLNKSLSSKTGTMKAIETRRKIGHIVSFEQARERLKDRTDLVLVEDGYRGWTKKSRFLDQEVGEEFQAAPDIVLRENRVHPKRKATERVRFFHSPSGETLYSFCSKNNHSYPLCVHHLKLKNQTEISSEEISRFSHERKSSLEKLMESELGVPFFNKKNPLVPQSRPDFKINDQVFLNVDGLYWHSTKFKSKNYHFDLRKEYEDKNLKLFQFYETEVIQQTQIVKSIILHAANQTTNKCYARKCIVRDVAQQQASNFLQENHLMGKIKAKHMGLFFDGDLVSILSYKTKTVRTNSTKEKVMNIERSCTKIFTSVVGGLSKLLKELERRCQTLGIDKIHNWVDLRYGVGSHLTKLGFTKLRDVQSWKWANTTGMFNRLYCRANMDERKLSQREYANEMKLWQIYDAGQRLFVKQL